MSFKDIPVFVFADASNTTQTLVVLHEAYNIHCQMDHPLLKTYVSNLDILNFVRKYSVFNFGSVSSLCSSEYRRLRAILRNYNTSLIRLLSLRNDKRTV